MPLEPSSSPPFAIGCLLGDLCRLSASSSAGSDELLGYEADEDLLLLRSSAVDLEGR